MEINYFITAKAEENVLGLNTSFSAEFKKGQTPKQVKVAASGYIPENGKQKYATINVDYDTETDNLQSINGSGVTQEFITTLMPLVKDFYNQLVVSETAL